MLGYFVELCVIGGSEGASCGLSWGFLGQGRVALVYFLQPLPFFCVFAWRIYLICCSMAAEFFELDAFLVIDLEGVESLPVSWKGLNALVVSPLGESIQRKDSSLTLFIAHYNLQFTILIYSFFYQLSSFPNLSFPILRALKPLSFIIRVLFPMHLSVTMPQVLHKATNVKAAAPPSVFTLTIALVIDVGPFVFFRAQLPYSIAKPQSIFEFSLVDRSIAPIVSPIPFWFSIGISAIITISVIEKLQSLPMLVPIFYISLILRKRRLDKPLPFWFIILPRTRVKLFPRLPLALPMLHTIYKTTMIDILIRPNKDPILILWLVIDKLADKDISIDVLQPISVLAVILEISLVEAKGALLVDQQAVTMVELVADISEVQGCHALVEEKFAELLELRYCQFLKEVIRVVDQCIVGFLLVPQELLNQLLLLCQQLFVKQNAVFFYGGGLFEGLPIVLFVHLQLLLEVSQQLSIKSAQIQKESKNSALTYSCNSSQYKQNSIPIGRTPYNLPHFIFFSNSAITLTPPLNLYIQPQLLVDY